VLGPGDLGIDNGTVRLRPQGCGELSCGADREHRLAVAVCDEERRGVWTDVGPDGP
jgi:hypothetical protein